MTASRHLQPSAGVLPVSSLTSKSNIGRRRSRATSKTFHSPVTNQSKIDPADQIRTKHLSGAHSGHRLSQRTDVRSERHDPTYHHCDRSDGSDLIGSE